MYTATMIYKFNSHNKEVFKSIWNETVFAKAVLQPGFVRMQLLLCEDEAMAIGSWKSQDDAQQFMQTGIFKVLMEKLSSILTEKPVPKIWDSAYLSEI